ncbi:hypothetical protein ACIGKM_11765 [Ectopseudomonas toyotomiensis]|uniref:hypothetical protein n=1 Tax=Ectopseudomonas toyotomiensis TaxID=554344 RepID=UPI0037CB39CC
MSNGKVMVVFAKSWRGYSKGEKAGFDEDQANALVKGKVAELLKAGKASAKPAAAPGSKGKGKGGSGEAAPEPGAGDETPPDPDTPPADEEAGDDDEPKP